MLRKLIPTHPLIRYLLTNVDSGLASTDVHIIKLYSSLITSPEAKSNILPLIIAEFNLTHTLVAELLQKPFEIRRPNHYYSTRLRAVALKSMHEVQVKTLHEWRNNKEHGQDELTSQQNILLLKTINAIANALGSTG